MHPQDDARPMKEIPFKMRSTFVLNILVLCVGTLSSIKASQALRINVHPQNATVSLLSNATFTCNVTGNPRSSIQWMKDGIVVSSSIVERQEGNETLISELHIVNVTAGDEGRYTCIANNTGALTNSSDAVLVIEDVPTTNSTLNGDGGGNGNGSNNGDNNAESPTEVSTTAQGNSENSTVASTTSSLGENSTTGSSGEVGPSATSSSGGGGNGNESSTTSSSGGGGNGNESSTTSSSGGGGNGDGSSTTSSSEGGGNGGVSSTTSSSGGGGNGDGSSTTSSSGGQSTTSSLTCDTKATATIHLTGENYSNPVYFDPASEEHKKLVKEIDNVYLREIVNHINGVCEQKSGTKSLRRGSIIADVEVYVDPDEANLPENATIQSAVTNAIIKANASDSLGSLSLLGVAVKVEEISSSSTSNPTVHSDDDSGLKDWQIVLIVLFVIILICVVAFVAFLIFYRKNTMESARELEEFPDEEDHQYAQVNENLYDNVIVDHDKSIEADDPV